MKMTFKFSNGRKCWKFAKGVREREREKMSERRCDGMENFLGNLDIFFFRFQLLEILSFAEDREKIHARYISVSQVKAKAMRDFLVIEVLSIENFAWVCVWVSFGPRARLSRQ